MQEMGENQWVDKMKDDLKSMADSSTELKHWEKHCIYRIPFRVSNLNKKAYKPQAVSFGPYHHSEEHLQPMEEHKHRAVLHFLKRSGKPLESYLNVLAEVVQDLKDAYDSLNLASQKDVDAFLKMMFVDGCFMLEILRIETLDDYASNDPVFSNHGKIHVVPYIRRDMLVLENQLPMLALDKLLEVENEKDDKDEEFINRLILKFCCPSTRPRRLGKCLHTLDAYRKSLIWEDPRPQGVALRVPPQGCTPVPDGGDEIIRSATELNEAGIRFKKSKTGSLKDITFQGGVLRLPPIFVDDATESIFLNLIAFERYHVGAGNEVTSYVFLMDNIIEKARDVSLLHSSGIIQNALGSDKAVAQLFNSLTNDITLDPDSCLNIVHKRVSEYIKKPWNAWRANLIHTYFRNPWAIVSVLAASLLFALTIVQTVYTIMSAYEDSPGCPCPPPPPPPRPNGRA